MSKRIEKSAKFPAPDFHPDNFRDDLLSWWASHRRMFPWRGVADPYRVLLAEALLHRTRADQVLPLYEVMVERYPDIQRLADAPEAEVLDVSRSAGLPWRIELLCAAAREIVQRFGGQIPRAEEDLLSLPGVGPYIAGAVRCFAFGIPTPILDTNTVRIISRLFDLPLTDASRRSRRFRELLAALVDPVRPAEFNYALLDHGAEVCRSRNPKCETCPVLEHCSTGRRLMGTLNAGA